MRISAASVSRSPGYILRSRPPRTSRGKFPRRSLGSSSPPPAVRNAFNGTCRGSVPGGPCLPMEAANFVSPDSHETRAPRYPYLPRYLPASLPSANIRELYPSIALMIPKTRVHYLSSRTLQVRGAASLASRELVRELLGLKILRRRVTS